MIVAFILKHFVCDFLLQRFWHCRFKGIYGHRGGLFHAGWHGLATSIIMYAYGYPVWYGALDFFIHYHVDFFKAKISKRYELTPAKNAFWILMGLDQCLHYLTYAMIIYLAIYGK